MNKLKYSLLNDLSNNTSKLMFTHQIIWSMNRCALIKLAELFSAYNSCLIALRELEDTIFTFNNQTSSYKILYYIIKTKFAINSFNLSKTNIVKWLEKNTWKKMFNKYFVSLLNIILYMSVNKKNSKYILGTVHCTPIQLINMLPRCINFISIEEIKFRFPNINLPNLLDLDISDIFDNITECECECESVCSSIIEKS